MSTSNANGCNTAQHSSLLNLFLPQIKTAVKTNANPVLDLACGTGRNGLFLSDQNMPVVFADRSNDAMATIKPKLSEGSRLWPVDLELPGLYPLANQMFSAVLVFRYLHRPLFEAIKQAVKPGGLIVYETFTIDQAKLGRPKNPDFLLLPGELNGVFADWQILRTFEGMINNSAVAQIVAVKP